MHVACREGHLDVVKVRLRHMPFLILSLQFLLQKGAYLRATDSNGLTPLHHACQKGRLTVAQVCFVLHMILSQTLSFCSSWFTKAPPLKQETRSETDPCTMHARQAISMSHRCGYLLEYFHGMSLKFLLQKGAYIEARNKNQTRPLHYASFGGHVDVVKVCSLQTSFSDITICSC